LWVVLGKVHGENVGKNRLGGEEDNKKLKYIKASDVRKESLVRTWTPVLKEYKCRCEKRVS